MALAAEHICRSTSSRRRMQRMMLPAENRQLMDMLLKNFHVGNVVTSLSLGALREKVSLYTE